MSIDQVVAGLVMVAACLYDYVHRGAIARIIWGVWPTVSRSFDTQPAAGAALCLPMCQSACSQECCKSLHSYVVVWRLSPCRLSLSVTAKQATPGEAVQHMRADCCVDSLVQRGMVFAALLFH